MLTTTLSAPLLYLCLLSVARFYCIFCISTSAILLRPSAWQHARLFQINIFYGFSPRRQRFINHGTDLWSYVTAMVTCRGALTVSVLKPAAELRHLTRPEEQEHADEHNTAGIRDVTATHAVEIPSHIISRIQPPCNYGHNRKVLLLYARNHIK